MKPETTALKAQEKTGTPRLLSRRQLLERVPLSYTSIWLRMRAGTFPRSVDMGGKPAWFEHEIDAWMASLPPMKFKGESADTEAAQSA